MTNRTIEAVLRLSAKLGSMGAFGQVAGKLAQVDMKARAFNRTQTAMTAGALALQRSLLSAVAGYGIVRGTSALVSDFAGLERQLTRTGLKVGATGKEMFELNAQAQKTAQRFAVSNASVVETIDAYAETGATFKDIQADIAGIVEATQAMGGEGRDVVNTWDTARKNFGLMSKDAERFFDIMAAGGNSGKFEGSDMAQYLPGLMPRASVLGMSGLSGTASLVGALEVMRDRTGTSEKAATALGDFLDKLNSPTVQRNFKKMNVDLPKALKDGRANGEPLFETMFKVLNKATKGDANLLGHLFTEQDSRSFATMLMQDLPNLLATIKELRENSAGTIKVNVEALTENAEAKLQHLENSWTRTKNTIGRALVDLGVADAADSLSSSIDSGLNKREGVMTALAKRGISGADAEMWILRNGFLSEDPVNRMAFEGGWRSPEGMLAAQGQPDVNPELPSHRQEKSTRGAIPIPTSRPASLGFPEMPNRLYGVPDDLRNPQVASQTQSFFGAGSFDAQVQQASEALKRGGVETAASVADGGKHAGDSIKEGADSLAQVGEQIKAAIVSGANSLAAAARAAAADLSRPIGSLPKANVIVGKSTAGRIMGPR